MDDLPEIYQLETVEQMRAIADELRVRLVDALALKPLTVTQLGHQLGIAPAKIHYHVRELERVGLVKLVATRENRGILEKYYRAVARTIDVPGTLLRDLAPDERIAAANDFVQIAAQGFLRAAAYAIEQEATLGSAEEAPVLRLGSAQVWMTRAELAEFQSQLKALLQPYEARRDLAGEREYTIVEMVYPTLPPATGKGMPGANASDET